MFALASRGTQIVATVSISAAHSDVQDFIPFSIPVNRIRLLCLLSKQRVFAWSYTRPDTGINAPVTALA